MLALTHPLATGARHISLCKIAVETDFRKFPSCLKNKVWTFCRGLSQRCDKPRLEAIKLGPHTSPQYSMIGSTKDENILSFIDISVMRATLNLAIIPHMARRAEVVRDWIAPFTPSVSWKMIPKYLNSEAEP